MPIHKLRKLTKQPVIRRMARAELLAMPGAADVLNPDGTVKLPPGHAQHMEGLRKDAENRALRELQVRHDRGIPRTLAAPAVSPIAVPGTFTADKYSAIANCKTESQSVGAVDIGYVENAAYVEYPLIAALGGNYTLTVKLAAVAAGSIAITLNGNPAATITVPNTKSWTAYQSVSVPLVLPSGAVALRLSNVNGNQYNLGDLTITPASVVPIPTPAPIPAPIPAPASSSVTLAATGSTVIAAIQNSSLSNCRLEVKNGKPDIGYVAGAAFTAYSLSVAAAGAYTITADLAAIAPGLVDFLVNGTIQASAKVPVTASWSLFEPTAPVTLVLPAGNVILHVANVNGNQYNLADITLTVIPTPTPAPIPAPVQVPVTVPPAGTTVRPPNPTDLTDYVPSTHKVYDSWPPSIHAITQMEYGDCYEQVVHGSIAAHIPAWLEQYIFDNGDGTGTVTYRRNGVVTNVVTPLTFPPELVAHGQATWGILAEKTYAYFRTGADTYTSLNEGWPTAVLYDLGIASASWSTSTANLATIAAGYIANAQPPMVCTNMTIQAGVPLEVDHCYVVLTVYPDGSYDLYNPWGFDGFNDDADPGDGVVHVTGAQLIANCDYLIAGLNWL